MRCTEKSKSTENKGNMWRSSWCTLILLISADDEGMSRISSHGRCMMGYISAIAVPQ